MRISLTTANKYNFFSLREIPEFSKVEYVPICMRDFSENSIITVVGNNLNKEELISLLENQIKFLKEDSQFNNIKNSIL